MERTVSLNLRISARYFVGEHHDHDADWEGASFIENGQIGWTPAKLHSRARLWSRLRAA